MRHIENLFRRVSLCISGKYRKCLKWLGIIIHISKMQLLFILKFIYNVLKAGSSHSFSFIVRILYFSMAKFKVIVWYQYFVFGCKVSKPWCRICEKKSQVNPILIGKLKWKMHSTILFWKGTSIASIFKAVFIFQ